MYSLFTGCLIFIVISFNFFTSCEIISCNFEEDFCAFQANEFIVRYTGESPSLTSGPIADHTTGEEGFYALCDGRLLKDPTSKCQLSANVNVETESDFEFWYYMYGTQIGTLELIKDSEEVLWSLTGRQKNEWLFAQIKIPAGDYLLEFSANRSTLGRTSSDIAIDDVIIEGQELTTIFNTPTRTPVSPVPLEPLSSADFDTFNNLLGWGNDYLNNKWIQTNGNMSKFVDSLGPGSDWKSITSFTINTTSLRPTTLTCAIPFSLESDPDMPLYYCQKITLRKDFACGLNDYPEVSDANSLGRCDLGYYMMVTSDKFETPQAAFRARFISPVYSLENDLTDFSINFKYNIYGNGTDGFRIIIENYLNPKEFKIIYTKRGPLYVDKWYSETALACGITYSQFRVVFEPIRGSSSEYASVSIDSIDYTFDICPTTLSSTMETTISSTDTSSLALVETTTVDLSTTGSTTDSTTHSTTDTTTDSTTLKPSTSETFPTTFSTRFTQPLETTEKQTSTIPETTKELTSTTLVVPVITTDIIITTASTETTSRLIQTSTGTPANINNGDIGILLAILIPSGVFVVALSGIIMCLFKANKFGSLKNCFKRGSKVNPVELEMK